MQLKVKALVLCGLLGALAQTPAAQNSLSPRLYGLDFLGLPKYDNVALKAFPQGWALGAFANTFGDALPAVEAIAKSGKTPLVRVHLVWNDQHLYGDKDVATVVKEAKRYQSLAVKYPSVRFELSPFCEHNVANPDKYLDLVAKTAPSCFPVNTPWQGGLSKKYKNETHGDKPLPRSYNFSYDGSSCVDADVTAAKKSHAKADVFFFWTYQFNLVMNGNDKTPRSERKAVPSVRLVESVAFLANDKQATKLPNGYIWKSHAEQNEAPVPEARAQKPVLIAPVKADHFELATAQGKVLATLPYYGTYGDVSQHLYRYYYSEAFGYDLAKRAVQLQGSPVLNLRVNGKTVGKVNPAFRDGTYR